MITRSRVRQLLVLALFAGYYALELPSPAAAVEFCDQVCHSFTYCGYSCFDENAWTYTYCGDYTGGNCDPNDCLLYSSGNWPITSRDQIGRRSEPTWWGFSFECVEYYRVHAVSICGGLGEHDWCEKDVVDQQECYYIGWGQSCDEAGLYDCYPGNDCH